MSSDKPGEEYQLPTPDLGVFGEKTETTEVPASQSPEPATTELPHPGPDADETRPHRGRMTFQTAATPKREPSLAEQRARQQAEAEAEAEAEAAVEAEYEQAARKRRNRRLLLIGGAVVIVVALIIGSQLLSNQTTTANCVGADSTDQDTVFNDQYCDQAYVTDHGGYVSNGIIFLPYGGGYRQYRYYYGGSVSNGHVTGGSYTPPSSGTIKTGSGKTVTRGGFGVPSGSSGGSGSHSGGSGGSGSGGKSGSGSHSGGGKHH